MIDPTEKIQLVELAPYNSEWPQLFREEAAKLQAILKDNCVQIHHIGSTAIPGIYAKPIIDILPVVKDLALVDKLADEFEKLDYIVMGEYGIPGRRFYWKSKTKRSHHIHLFEQGSPEILRHVMFKDFLINHPDYAQAYSQIKQSLAKVFFDDIESYVNGKSSFVQMIDYKNGQTPVGQLNAEDNISIEPYNPAWLQLAEAEITAIKLIAKLPYARLEHIGSTAVPQLASKPIIDIFIELNTIEEASQWIKPLEVLGYVFWDENPDKSHLRFFKGMPPYGRKRTHHVHIVSAESHNLEPRVLFKEILKKNQEIRLQYESLKLELAGLYPSDREAYTDKKGKFIGDVLRSQGYLKPIKR